MIFCPRNHHVHLDGLSTFWSIIVPLLLMVAANQEQFGCSASGTEGETGGTDDDFDLVQDKHECVPISMSLCKDIGYNHTVFPNLVGIENQRDADEQLQTYQPLIKIQCSSQLRFFLCSVYAPMCTEKIEKKIGPCRPLCQAVKQRCEPMLKQFGFEWPSLLDCDQFPGSNDDGNMCMIGPGESKADNNTPIIKPIGTGGGTGSGRSGQPELAPGSRPVGGSLLPAVECPNTYGMIYINNSDRCSPKCPSELVFTGSEQRIALIWMGCLSGICIILSLVALLAVLVSSYRFRYPERPLIAINICYVFFSVSYLIRIFSGHTSVACTMHGTASVLVVQGLQNLRCTFIFLFQYYFSLMAALWWLVLCLTWCLTVAPGWSPDAMDYHSRYYHILAWVLPVLLTIVVLVRQSVEADELTGMCNVGNVNTDELMHFVILPHLVCLVLGMALLTVGFVSALCCCNKWVSSDKQTSGAAMQCGAAVGANSGAAGPLMGSNAGSSGTGGTAQNHHQNVSGTVPMHPYSGGGGSNGNRLDASLLRLGFLIFSHLIPSTCLLAAYFYEWLNRRSWSDIGTRPRGGGAPNSFHQSADDYFHQRTFRAGSGAAEFGVPYRDSGSGSEHSLAMAGGRNRPNFDTFIMKIVASVIWGIISALWLIFRVVGYHCGRYPHHSKAGFNTNGCGGHAALRNHQLSGGVTGLTGASSCGGSQGCPAGSAGTAGSGSYNTKLNQHNSYLQQSLLMNNAAAAAAAANCCIDETLVLDSYSNTLRNYPASSAAPLINSSKPLLNRSYSPGNTVSGHLANVPGGFQYDPQSTTLI